MRRTFFSFGKREGRGLAKQKAPNNKIASRMPHSKTDQREFIPATLLVSLSDKR